MSLVSRAAYFARNIAEQIKPQPALDKVVPFRIDAQRYPGEYLAATASPSRTLSNLFWLTLPAEEIAAALGAVRLVDVGCGAGGYAALFADRFPDMQSYLGIDIAARDAWRERSARDARCRFVAAPAETIDAGLLGDTTLIVSQSALEHFPHDLVFARNVRDWAVRAGHPVLQLHLLPGAYNWRQYGTHGFRGYTARSLARLIDAFAPDDHRVFVLGGAACNDVHYRWIYDRLRRRAHDRRDDDAAAYAAELSAALAADAARPHVDVGAACFLALATLHGGGDLAALLQRRLAP